MGTPDLIGTLMENFDEGTWPKLALLWGHLTYSIWALCLRHLTYLGTQMETFDLMEQTEWTLDLTWHSDGNE